MASLHLFSFLILFGFGFCFHDPCSTYPDWNCTNNYCDHRRHCIAAGSNGDQDFICHCPYTCSSTCDDLICLPDATNGAGTCQEGSPGKRQAGQCPVCDIPLDSCSVSDIFSCLTSTCTRFGDSIPCGWNDTGRGSCFCPLGTVCGNARSEYECQFFTTRIGPCVWSRNRCSRLMASESLVSVGLSTSSTSFSSSTSFFGTLQFKTTIPRDRTESTDSSIPSSSSSSTVTVASEMSTKSGSSQLSTTSTSDRWSSSTLTMTTKMTTVTNQVTAVTRTSMSSSGSTYEDIETTFSSSIYETSSDSGQNERSENTERSDSTDSIWWIAGVIAITCLSLTSLCTVGAFLLFKKLRRSDDQKMKGQELDSSLDSSLDNKSTFALLNPDSYQATQYVELPEPKNGALDQMVNYEIDFSELKLKEKLGEGQHGIVYKAIWRNIIVACKVLKSEESMNSAERIEEFKAEAKLHKEIPQHPNLVQFLAVSNNPELRCIIVEYVAMGSLLNKLKKEGPMKGDDEASLRIIMGIAKGMEHLHNNNLIHRDLASRNVLLASDLSPKVTDFGMSRLLQSEQYITQSNVLPLRWLAPETVRDRTFTNMSDVWSFGITLYEILTAKIPYGKGLKPVEVAQKVGWEGLTVRPPEWTPHVLAKMMKQCLSQEAMERPSFTQIQQFDLQEL